ncbi:protoporphyrinogen oxidase [Thermoflavimicrobium dichotomicum]|uniref:Coproporphyrinogen III oxidase n=1 Tax=Thermoflavimicrobium dichotomicum TaxID=46223 RepID=A0A1I3RYK0_9BACL|nr:protoporphyrinogen oxidase [Thermoflavimicrobium dichotomicum]SFJ51388.1 oxygen-dependent protoporphyrinogen oxidase [Thermoflavimicrobium dichotomicum]
MSEYQIVIIGGGITGLSAAYYLYKTAKEQKTSVHITLLEEQQRLGGKIWTERWNGFVMEKGPDSFLERKASAKQLALDLGLEDQLVRNRTGQAYILHKGKLHPIPEGAVMGVPTQISPFIATRLFSISGKMRASLDLFLPRQSIEGDISVGEFFRRRLGNEVVDHLIEPLLSGIYAGNLDRLSLKATFPQFAQMEEKYRSLILGMKKTRPAKKLPGEEKGQFLTLKNGLSTLVEAIGKELPPETIHLGCKIKEIQRENHRYQLSCENGHTFLADAVIVTTPFPSLQKMMPSFTHPQPVQSVPATSVATVILGFDSQDVQIPYEGTGFVVPRTENTTITACTWTNKKWPHTTPEGKILMRCYVGRSGDEAIVDEPDEIILQRVRQDLAKVMHIEKEPLFYRVTRWHRSMPQYTVGHADWVKQLEETLHHHFPGLFFAGASYHGVGIPDCIDQGKRAVEEVLQYIHTHSHTTNG